MIHGIKCTLHLIPFSFIIKTSNNFPLFIMRLIEEQMNSAIRGQRNFRKDNTEVVTTDNGLESVVYLHGNMIAVYFHDTR